MSHEKAPEKTSPADATAQPAKAQAAEPSEADGKDGNENQNADGGDKNKSTEATWNSDEYWDVTQGYAAGQNQLFVLSLSPGKKNTIKYIVTSDLIAIFWIGRWHASITHRWSSLNEMHVTNYALLPYVRVSEMYVTQ